MWAVCAVSGVRWFVRCLCAGSLVIVIIMIAVIIFSTTMPLVTVITIACACVCVLQPLISELVRCERPCSL